jgi:hypothetical protein
VLRRKKTLTSAGLRPPGIGTRSRRGPPVLATFSIRACSPAPPGLGAQTELPSRDW